MKVIACADLHLRHCSDIPRWRGEDEYEWYSHQKLRLETVVNRANALGCPILIAGDIFHRADPGLSTVEMFNSAMRECKAGVGIMAGNHDVRYSKVNDKETGFAILDSVFHSFDHFPGWSSVPYGTDRPIKDAECLGVHTLLFKEQEDVPYGVSHYDTPETLVAKFPASVLIVGDMHKPFKKKVGNSLVVNCGSMTVQSINEAEYSHGFWIVDIDEVSAEFIQFTDPCMILSKEQLAKKSHDKEKGERRERISQMVNVLRGKTKHSIDFESNLEYTLTTEAVSGKIVQKARAWIR